MRGPHLYRRGRVWWFYDGPGERESLRTSDEAEARSRFTARLADPLRKRRARGAERTLAELREAYIAAPHGWTASTWKSARVRSAAFVAWMVARGVDSAARLSSAIVSSWRSERMANVSAATINRDEDVTRKMLRWASEQDPPLCAPVAAFAKRRRQGFRMKS